MRTTIKVMCVVAALMLGTHPNGANAQQSDEAAELAKEKARQEVVKATYDAMKAAAEAKKAADAAAVQAMVGSVPSPPTGSPTGAIDVQPNAGKAEAALLSARAVSIASAKLVKSVSANVRNKRVVVVAGADALQLQTYQQFNLRRQLLKLSLEEGGRLYEKAEAKAREVDPRATSTLEGAAPLSVAGAAIDALSKLGSYFQSDYKIGAVEVTKDNDLLVSSVIKDLLKAGSKPVVPTRLQTNPDAVVQEIKTLQETILMAASLALDAEKEAKKYAAKAEKSQNNKAAFMNVSKLFTTAQVALERTIASYGEFIASMSAVDGKGVPALAKIITEQAIHRAIEAPDTLVLQIDIKSATGGYYTQRNLWTFFGSTPFYVMGGVVVDYTLLQRSSAGADILAADVIRVHGGYAKIGDVEDLVEAPVPEEIGQKPDEGQK